MGRGSSVAAFPVFPPVATAYCKVTVEGAANTIRADFAVVDASGNTIAVSEAR